jgi:FkbM family methyltransferase
LEIDEVEYKGYKFKYRPNTTDWGVIQEAFGGLNTAFFDVEYDEIWYDFGAHIGAFTCYAASEGAKVISFEPIPDNLNLLFQNIELNGFENQVLIFPCAVLKDDGELDIYNDPINCGHCGKYDDKGLETIKVKVKSISKIIFPDTFNIKLDVEGSELEILEGLDLSKVKKLVMEFHYWYPHLLGFDIKSLLNKNFSHVTQEREYMFYAWK